MASIVLPDVPNVCKIVMQGTANGGPFVNAWFVSHTPATLDSTAMNALATACSSAYWANFGSSFATGAAHVQTTAIDLSSRQGAVGVDVTAHNGSQTVTSGPPASFACCISWVIQDRYRGGHPRMYLPGLSTGDITGGRQWTSAAQSRYNGEAAGFHSAMSALVVASATWKQVAVRYWSHGVLMSAALVRDVTGVKVHSRVDTMRRRLGKELA